jgi:PAS domain S-box-containing protein
LKKKLIGCILVVVFSLVLFSETALEKIERQSLEVQGKERINLLLELTEGYKKSQPQKAIKYGKEALELLKNFPEQKVRSTILNNMSIASRHLGEYQYALEFAHSSLAAAENNGDEPGMARALDSLGNASSFLEEFDQALHYYLKSAQLFEEYNDQISLAWVYNLIASTYWRLSDYATAMKYLFKSLTIYEELKDFKGIGLINNNLGLLYWQQLKDTDKSLKYFRKSLAVNEILKDKNSTAITLNNMGLVYSQKKEYKEALEYFQKAFTISNKLGDKKLTSTFLYNIGEIYNKMGNDQRALEYINQSLEFKQELNEKQGIAKALILKASVNLGLGKYNEGIQQAEQALDLAKQIKVKAEISLAYQVLSQSYEALGDLRSALDYYKKFKALNDEIFDENSAKEIAGLETNFQIEKDKKEIELLKKDRENQRTMFISLILFALLILTLAFVIYTRYRLKDRAARELKKEINERIQTEEKLRESEEKFRALAEKSFVGIWIIQDQGIKYANPRSLEIFGYTREEMINKNPLELVIEEDRPKMAKQLAEGISGRNNTMFYQFKGITKEGEIIHLESYGALTHYQGQPAVLESVINITRRKKAEAELLMSRKLESVGILAGGIAHDFNNLLAIIVGNNSLLQLRIGNKDPHILELLENIERASDQGANLAQKFITFSSGGWIIRGKTTLAKILKEAANFSPEINEIPYDVIIPPDLEPIYGDERQLRQVFTNLLFNAYEADPDKNKKITVTARNINIEKENPFSLIEGEYVKISVIDRGLGIPAESLEKVFDPYFSTKDTVTQKGLGLGLAICYFIVKKHEGHIAITSEVQKGTTVDIYLPVFST